MKAIANIICALLLIYSISCKSDKTQPDGGPCSYQITPYPAIVISIDSTYADMTNVWCRVNAIQADTVDYYNINNRFTTLSAIKLENLKPGDTVIYEHHEITSGACNPDVFRLLLKQEVK